jgi:hypothetical protein
MTRHTHELDPAVDDAVDAVDRTAQHVGQAHARLGGPLTPGTALARRSLAGPTAGAGSRGQRHPLAGVAAVMGRAAASPAVVAVLVASPGYRPDASTAPGKAVVQDLLNTVAFYCLALALGAFAIGAATWGIGGRVMHSSGGAAAGKMTMLAAVGGAILLGAGPAIIAWALALGAKA